MSEMKEGRSLRKLFSNNYFFWPFYAVIMILILAGTGQLVGTVTEIARDKQIFTKKLKKDSENIDEIQKELNRRQLIIDTTKKNLKELDERIDKKKEELLELNKKIDEQSSHRWHSYDMKTFCKEAEKLNKDFKCPNIDSIDNACISKD